MASDLKYSKEHIWARLLEPARIRIGITPFAGGKLGEIIAVELPEIGDGVQAGQSIGTVESVKTVSDIYSPVDGMVVEINHALDHSVADINVNPLEQGWIAELKMAVPEQWNKLLSEEEYRNWIDEVGKE